MFADPRKLYYKEKHLFNKPFYFDGKNGKAVLLLHGWSSVPYEVRRLGKYLNENGYTAYGPMLSGHGTVPNDLENIAWQKWMKDASEAYDKLKKNHQQVFICGTSIGSNIALLLAQEKKDIDGLVLLATPYKIRWEKIITFFAKTLVKFKKYNRKFYPPSFGSKTLITRLISYQSYPIRSALEAFEVVKKSRENLALVFNPCFLVQSSSDHIICRKSMERIYSEIGSKIKKKRYLRRAYHTFISDVRNEHIFEDILNFLNKI